MSNFRARMLFVAIPVLGLFGFNQAPPVQTDQAAVAPQGKICPECLRYYTDPNKTVCDRDHTQLVKDEFGLNQRAQTKSPAANVNAIAFRSAAQYAVATESGIVELRTTDDPQAVSKLTVEGWARDVRFSPNGSACCVASVTRNPKKPKDWQGKLSTFRLNSKGVFAPGPVRTLDQVPTATTFVTNRWALTGDVGGKLLLWRASANLVAGLHPIQLGSSVVSLARSPKSSSGTSQIAAGTLTGIVDIVGFRADDSGAPNEPEPKRVRLTNIKVADSNINGVAFDPTGAKIAAACDDGSVSVWDIHSQGREHYLKPEHLPGGKPDRATSVCYLTPTRLAAGFASGRIVLWDVKHADRPVTLEHSHEAGVFGLDYSPGSTQRLVSGAGTSIKVWTVLGLGGPPPSAPNSPGTGEAPGNIKNPPAPPAPPAFPGIWDPLTHKGAAVGDTITRQEDGSVYVWVPAGTFKYGLDDKPTDVEGYWIARDCVTWRQYLKFCDATAYRTPDDPKFKHGMDDPVVMVSLEDAKKYASWAKAQLPTEIQWEKAARFTDGRTYPWGNTWNAGFAQVSEDADGKAGHTSPVSAHDDGKSPYGCRDMVGNVAQWVLDSVKDPPEPVVRGIGWFDSDIPLRPCVSRVAPLASPTYRKDIGFRLAGPILK